MVRPRLIALDLDETLLNRRSRLSPANDAALRRAIAAGVEIVVATGRAYATVPEEIRRYPGIRCAITGNGAAVYDLTTGEAVFRRTLPKGAAAEILRLTEDADVAYEAFLDGEAYAGQRYLGELDGYMMDDQRQEYVLATRIPVPDIRAFVLEHGDRMDSLAVIPRNMPVKLAVTERLRQGLREVYITTSSVRLIEINHQDCTKASALKRLAERLNIPREETAAFGNGDNDADMLIWAGCGVAMGDATEYCRASADHICAPYLQDGVAETFEEIFGI